MLLVERSGFGLNELLGVTAVTLSAPLFPLLIDQKGSRMNYESIDCCANANKDACDDGRQKP